MKKSTKNILKMFSKFVHILYENKSTIDKDYLIDVFIICDSFAIDI